MTCREVEEQEILERYVLNRLTDEERDAFELHYLECDSCFAQLQTGLALQEDLEVAEHADVGQVGKIEESKACGVVRRDAVIDLDAQPSVPNKVRHWVFGHIKVWVPALAALVLLSWIGVWRYKRHAPPVKNPPSAGVGSVPSTAQTPAPPPSLEELARVQAPPYSDLTARGNEDKADIIFGKAMQHYLKQDYAGAIPGLRAAVNANPKKARFDFYLGSCYLLTGQNEKAMRSLSKAVSLEDPVYSKAAHFYLAKTYLKNHDVSQAKAEFRVAANSGGSRAAEAAEILHQLGK